jgi:uroporphyrinogen decarboxylase
VFETNADQLSPHRFRAFALPYLRSLVEQVRARVPAVSAGGPILLLFAKGAHACLEELAATTDYDGLSLDWSLDPADAVRRINAATDAAGRRRMVVQGNLDPCELFGSEASIRAATSDMLRGFGYGPRDTARGVGTRYIANLGHGMLPSHTPEGLRAYFDAVAAESAALLRE